MIHDYVVTSVAVNPCNLFFNVQSVCRRILFQVNFHAIAIKKILLKKEINAAGKAGLGFIFDVRDRMRIYKKLFEKACDLGIYNIFI